MSSQSKEHKPRSSNQEVSSSAGKSAGVDLVLCCMWKCVPAAISGGVDIFVVSECQLLRQMSPR